jgi:ribosomal protein L2
MAALRLPSGEIRWSTPAAAPTIGAVGNEEHELINSARPAAPAGRASARRPAVSP